MNDHVQWELIRKGDPIKEQSRNTWEALRHVEALLRQPVQKAGNQIICAKTGVVVGYFKEETPH